jgi:hypothetical protein
MDQLQESIKKEAAKLEELLKQAGYKMINFDIEKIQPENDHRSIHIWARYNDD